MTSLYSMIAFTFIFFIKVTELKKKDQARGGGGKKKVCLHYWFCSFCLSRTRKQVIEVDLFIYLPANVTFISDTLNIQWSRWLWREKNAEFSLKFPVRIRSKINLDSVGMNESKTSFRQQLWRALPDWQICIFQFGKGGCRGLKQMHTDWQSLPYLLHSSPKGKESGKKDVQTSIDSTF